MPTMDEAVLKRILPHSVEAEQSVIGSMIMDRDAILIASEILKGDDFYGKHYGMLFDIMVELYNSGVPVDVVTLQNRLREKDVPVELSNMEFVRDVVSAVPSSANVKHYAQIVADKAMLRRMIRVNEDIANACYADKEETTTILEETEKKVFELTQRRNTGEIVPIRQAVMETMEQIEIAARTKGGVTGLATGFIDLDRMLAGLHPSNLILVAARPAMGKTAFVLNIARNVAFKQDKHVAIFSLEMGQNELVQRFFAMESKVDSQNIRTGNMSAAEWQSLIEAMDVVASSNVIIDDTSGITVSEVRSKCRKIKAEQGLDLVVIDYIQLMSGDGRAGDSRQQEISEISRGLKGLAKELKVPVIALSQLSRAPELRTDHRPILSDLRESGAIEQDADVVMFIYRDEYYNKDTEKKGVAEIIIQKQRAGSTGKVELAWLGQYTQFANLSR